MTICYLALGSNLKNPRRQLKLAIAAIESLPKSHLVKVAPLYASRAWGRKTQPSFCNTVLALKTCLAPSDLLRACQAIEKKLGRARRVKWGARTLDIDIILYGEKRILRPHIIIPHPSLLERDFVCLPLLSIAPSAKMPEGNLIKDLIQAKHYCQTIKKLLTC